MKLESAAYRITKVIRDKYSLMWTIHAISSDREMVFNVLDPYKDNPKVLSLDIIDAIESGEISTAKQLESLLYSIYSLNKAEIMAWSS